MDKPICNARVFVNNKIRGTSFISATDLGRLEMELHIRNKNRNIIGLQLAGLIVSPMGRFVLGKRIQKDWEII